MELRKLTPPSRLFSSIATTFMVCLGTEYDARAARHGFVRWQSPSQGNQVGIVRL